MPRITLDLDSSLQSTQRRAGGTAVGFNKNKKGARSYDPRGCTVAQTGQELTFPIAPVTPMTRRAPRSLSSNAWSEPREATRREVRKVRPFFSDEILSALYEQDVEFSTSVPPERFAELKQMLEGRQR